MQAPGRKSLTVLAVIAPFAGFGLGALARATDAGWLLCFAAIAKPAGTLWTNTLRMIVLPLMISYLVLKMVLNVTADMTVATIVARFASREDPAAVLTESGLLAAET